ncbi:hypothetical protein DFH08DRAFT_903651, partial [Mycena albidolilacea]
MPSIVAHIPWLILMYELLFKYFFKPLDHANWAISKQSSNPHIEAAMCLASFHISEKQPGIKRLPIHLPGHQCGQMARKNGSESDATLLVQYMLRPHHPELDNMTYVEFGSKCRLEKHDPDQRMHALQIMENEFPSPPRTRIRFYQPGHIGVCRIQM